MKLGILEHLGGKRMFGEAPATAGTYAMDTSVLKPTLMNTVVRSKLFSLSLNPLKPQRGKEGKEPLRAHLNTSEPALRVAHDSRRLSKPPRLYNWR